MNSIVLRLAPLGCLLAFVASTSACAAVSVPLDLCEMKPIFMEEFDTQSIAARMLGGRARWTAHTPWNGDFGDATFSDPGPNGFPFSVADGILQITARRDQQGRWRSGLIAASDASGAGTGTRYGYFEARMRLPPGPGTWPAFWLGTLKPASDPSPGIEVDVVEYYGHSTSAYNTALHVWFVGETPSRHEVHTVAVPDKSLVQGFHTYGVRVAPDVMTFYLDRVATWQVPTPAELRKPLFPIVNLALGSGFSIAQTPDPSTLSIDYVHVYALDAAGRQSRCPATPAPTP